MLYKRMMTLAIRSVATAAIVGLMLANASHGAEFIPMCDDHQFGALNVSDDGQVVACYSRSDAYIWTEADGKVALDALPDGEVGRTRNVSGNGKVIVGNTGSMPDYEAVRWTAESGALTSLGQSGIGFATTERGDMVVGYSFSPFRAWYWTEADGGVNLSEEVSRANDVSSDGGVIVGNVDNHHPEIAYHDAVLWTRDGTLQRLEPPEGFEVYHSSAGAVSADGSAIVGFFQADGVGHPFLWTGNRMQLLGDLATNPWANAAASGVSNFGEIVVGGGETDDGGQKAFIWNDNLGMLDLKSVLVNEYGLGAALEGWDLNLARDISPNGRFIVGSGTNPQGVSQGWLARLDYAVPEPTSSISMLLGLLTLFQCRTRSRSRR